MVNELIGATLTVGNKQIAAKADRCNIYTAGNKQIAAKADRSNIYTAGNYRLRRKQTCETFIVRITTDDGESVHVQ